MHPLLHHPVPGTRLTVPVLEGRSIPAPGARWTLVVLGVELQPEVDAVRANLSAEGVTAVVVPSRPSGATGALLLDRRNVVQHVGASVEDALDAVRAFRVGDRAPIPFAESRAPVRCPAAGRHRPPAGLRARRRPAA